MYLCPFVPRLRSHTPDSSGKPAGCAAPEDLERIAGLGPKKIFHYRGWFGKRIFQNSNTIRAKHAKNAQSAQRKKIFRIE